MTQSYQPEDGFRIQAVNEFCVFSTQALTSLMAGWLVFSYGWFAINLLAIPILALVMLARWTMSDSAQPSR